MVGSQTDLTSLSANMGKHGKPGDPGQQAWIKASRVYYLTKAIIRREEPISAQSLKVKSTVSGNMARAHLSAATRAQGS